MEYISVVKENLKKVTLTSHHKIIMEEATTKQIPPKGLVPKLKLVIYLSNGMEKLHLCGLQLCAVLVHHYTATLTSLKTQMSETMAKSKCSLTQQMSAQMINLISKSCGRLSHNLANKKLRLSPRAKLNKEPAKAQRGREMRKPDSKNGTANPLCRNQRTSS